MDPASLIALLALSISTFISLDAIFITTISLLAFGSLAVLPPGITGGVTVTAANFGFAIIIFKTIAEFGLAKMLLLMLPFNKYGLLTLYIIQSMICTAFFPWVFGNQIDIYPLRSSSDVYFTVPLSYSMGNLTQQLYLLESYLVTIVVAIRFNEAGFNKLLNRSLYSLTAFIVITGILDILGLNSFLDYFRNATYALAGETSIGSTKRIIGAMPEASAFGGLSAILFSTLFLMRQIIGMNYKWAVAVTFNLLFACLSTSSTAYGVLGATIFVYFIQILVRLIFDSRIEKEISAVEVLTIIIIATLIFESLMLTDDLRERIVYLLNALIFDKSSSSSYEERTRWSRTAYEAFVASYGLGIGVGSARTSNGMVNILASTGAIGLILFLIFTIRLFFFRPKENSVTEKFSSFIALIPAFVGFSLSSTTADFGVLIALLFGMQSQSNKLATSRKPNLNLD